MIGMHDGVPVSELRVNPVGHAHSGALFTTVQGLLPEGQTVLAQGSTAMQTYQPIKMKRNRAL